ncbi:hypothetical protein DVA86_15820 [Streptomyces armeniacus]|uniref:Uncharacterized protein n=1 Tax=Streptomyces armeniacus TaxID=83291 RepID=A0A345XQJ2_9ACTN|nr:hypothetical protein [Streptomyces armeniacus]AXK33908.1 hypothetical protein DVA86_15820 [Streptomyces armeniacus]
MTGAANMVLAVVVVLLLAVPIVVAALKGKYGMVVLGVLVHPCWWVAAIRLAKPHSFWARRFYDEETLREAQHRYPDGPRPRKRFEDRPWRAS